MNEKRNLTQWVGCIAKNENNMFYEQGSGGGSTTAENAQV